MKPGTKVKMSKVLVQRQKMPLSIIAHVKEFSNCIGIIENVNTEGWMPPSLHLSKEIAPIEFDVRWLPGNFRYLYVAKELVEVTNKEWDQYCSEKKLMHLLE